MMRKAKWKRCGSGRRNSYESRNGISSQQIFRRRKLTLDQELWRSWRKIALVPCADQITIVYRVHNGRRQKAPLESVHRANGLTRIGLTFGPA